MRAGVDMVMGHRDCWQALCQIEQVKALRQRPRYRRQKRESESEWTHTYSLFLSRPWRETHDGAPADALIGLPSAAHAVVQPCTSRSLVADTLTGHVTPHTSRGSMPASPLREEEARCP